MRNRVPSRLPRLPERLKFLNGEPASEALFQLLRTMARRHRTAQDQTFYSLREIGDHFDLPVSLVSRVFARLEREGLLGRVRGSRTVLQGRKFDRHLYVRGVIGIPVSTFRFAVFADYREFVTLLRRKLRGRGFMPAAVFYERGEEQGDFLAQSFSEANADTVVWFSPPRGARETIAALHDAGTRVIGLSDKVTSPLPCRYHIQRDLALRVILRDWRAAGLASTVVVTAARTASPVNEEVYARTSEEESLLSKVVILKESDNPQTLSRNWKSAKGGVLLTQVGAAFLAAREPNLFARLTNERRIALIEGPVSVTFGAIPSAMVDVIKIDWEKVATKVVDDLLDHAAWSTVDNVVFQAASFLRVPLIRCCSRL